GGARRAADLRLAQLDHVLAQVVLLLRPPEEELSRGVLLPRSAGEGAADQTRRSVVEDEIRAHRPGASSRRGRGAADQLDRGGVPLARQARRVRGKDHGLETAGQSEAGGDGEDETDQE